MAVKNEGARIYNLFPRLVGPMSKWKDHFKRAKKMGFNWIYINPFHYPGFSGSLYAPKDYYEFNPLFLDPKSKEDGMTQLKNMIDEAHDLKLKLIMDLVINHTAKDHPFTKSKPDWYHRDDKGNVKSPGAYDNGRWIEWGDLAEIDNLHSPSRNEIWNYWKELVLFYIDKGFDGFRADAAYSVPSELWKMLISSAKEKNSEIKFFAESLGCTPIQTKVLAESGFDYIFNSSKWWNFYDGWLMEQYNQTRSITPSISFPESHDTTRLFSDYNGNINAVKQRIYFAAFFSTGWMIPIGLEYCFKNKVDVVHTYPEHWENINYDLTDFITELNNIRKKYQIFNEEAYTEIKDAANWNVLAMLKTSNNGKEKVLLILNKDIHNKQRAYFGNIKSLFFSNSKNPIIDISPQRPMDFIPDNFEYYLDPGEMRILYNKL